MKRTAFVLLGLLLVAGLAILFYPSLSSWYNEQYQIRAVVDYDRSIGELEAASLQEELEKARAYNAALADLALADPFGADDTVLPENYTAILNTGNGVMGSIQIPEIDVNLPIYHGTGKEALEKGVGHMEMTAFPVGGTGNHTVLTGHTGLPDAQLFTDLNQLGMGDVFTIQVYKQTLVYRVDNIAVVLPSDTALLAPEDGMDYVTLVTCTPYGVNSHRLLVRGVRVPFAEAEEVLRQVAETAVSPVRYDFLIAMAALVLVLLAVILLCTWRSLRRRRGRS